MFCETQYISDSCQLLPRLSFRYLICTQFDRIATDFKKKVELRFNLSFN